MENELKQLHGKAKERQSENKKFFTKLKKRPPKHLDYLMTELHEKEFERTDCLLCSNCCKTTSPLFTQTDIGLISRHLRMRPSDFVIEYLRLDEDQDYVLQQVPCAFLGPDNHCSIYDTRPKACKEFPHTNRKKFQNINHLTLKNVSICPAAFNIVEALKKRVNF